MLLTTTVPFIGGVLKVSASEPSAGAQPPGWLAVKVPASVCVSMVPVSLVGKPPGPPRVCSKLTLAG